MIKLNLGCGKNVLSGWENIDIFPHKKGVIAKDLSKGIPYKKGSVDFIYTEHFLEHLDEVDGFDLLKECYRVMKKGGVIRISVPNLDILINQIVLNFKKDFSLKEYPAMDRGFSSVCQLMNFWFYGQGVTKNPIKFRKPLGFKNNAGSGGHKYYYTFDDLSKKLKQIGFTNVGQKKYRESDLSLFKNIETRDNRGELIIEATK